MQVKLRNYVANGSEVNFWITEVAFNELRNNRGFINSGVSLLVRKIEQVGHIGFWN